MTREQKTELLYDLINRNNAVTITGTNKVEYHIENGEFGLIKVRTVRSCCTSDEQYTFEEFIKEYILGDNIDAETIEYT